MDSTVLRPFLPFLKACVIVDSQHPAVQALAASLRADDPTVTAQRCFDWVRDQIQHCLDFQREEVPVIASDVLATGTGFCLAKSHLLVALWRANGIPSGFCYQRLQVRSKAVPTYCLHGFTAVWLDTVGWYRCDARGNTKPGVHCAFTPGQENLAFAPQSADEYDFPGIWAEPWPNLIEAMQAVSSVSQYSQAPIDLQPLAAADVVLTMP